MSLIPEPIKKEPTPPPPPPPSDDKPGKLSYDRGILMLTTEFDNEKIMPIVKAIIEYNLMDSPPEEITLYINSPGGEVPSCFHLIDVMKQSRIPVNTYGIGLVASCAFLTLMAGKRRFTTQNTLLMSHVYTTRFEGKESDLAAFETRTGITSAMMLNHYKKCTGKSETYIRKHLLKSSDAFLSPEECVTRNVIDTIIQTY